MKGVIVIVTLFTIQKKFHELFLQNGMPIHVKKGSYIFREGEPVDSIFYIANGGIQIGKENENGKELTIRICGTGAVFGEGSIFANDTLHSTTAKAIQPSKIYILNLETLELLLTENPTLLIEYIQWVQIENTKNQTRIRDLVMHGKKGALYSTLIRLANTYGHLNTDGQTFIDIALTNSEVANLCGTSREMINRMLNDLKRDHIISFERGYITIKNLQYLKDEIHCENCPLNICRID